MIIDVHGHITSPELFKKYPMPPSLANIDGMIEQKLRAGIDLTIVGSPVGAGTMTKMPDLDNYAQTVDGLKRFHEWLAGVVSDHPTHLKAYAYTNPFGSDKLLESTRRTVKDGGFVGMIINTSIQGEYLDSERADDFFAMAAEMDVPIFLHPPAEPVGSERLRDPRLIEQVGRFSDVTIGLAALIFGGRLEHYPNLHFLAATAGGAISLLAEKLDLAYQPRHWAAKRGQQVVAPMGRGNASIIPYQNKITQPPSAFIKRIFVDTANMSPSNHDANLQVMGVEQMLFGTDSPPLPSPLEQVVALVQNLSITEEEKQKIFYKNAMRLFKLGDQHSNEEKSEDTFQAVNRS